MNACLNFDTVEHWDYISQYPTSFQGWKSGPWWTPPHSKEWRRRCPCCWTVPPLWPWTWTGQCPFCGWNKTIVGLSKRTQKTIQFWFSLLSWWVAANIDWRENTGAQLWVGPNPTVFRPICQVSIYILDLCMWISLILPRKLGPKLLALFYFWTE